MLCLRIRDLLWLFHCTRVQERGLNVRTIEVLASSMWLKKIYAGILVDRVQRVTGGFIDDEQGGLTAGNECVDQIFTLKQIGEEAREKKRILYVGFIDLEKAYDKVNREALWQVLQCMIWGVNF